MDTEGLQVSVEPILQARSLVKRYGRVTALDHADFDLYPGEILAVIGDNGAGKSSMIKALCGAVIPIPAKSDSAARSCISRPRLTRARLASRRWLQNLALSPALSIADNMFLGREIRSEGVLGVYFRALDRVKMQKFSREKLNELGLMTIQNINQPVENFCLEASDRGSRLLGPPPSPSASLSWTNRRRRSASRNRAVCSNSLLT